MQVEINKYYTDILSDIIGWIKVSTPGKRAWTESNKPGWSYDYSMTERSTFPEWVRFWYARTPKKERFEYLITDRKPYQDGYFNDNTRNLLILLNRAKDTGIVSKKSERLLIAFDYIVQGYLEEMEYINMEECPF